MKRVHSSANHRQKRPPVTESERSTTTKRSGQKERATIPFPRGSIVSEVADDPATIDDSVEESPIDPGPTVSLSIRDDGVSLQKEKSVPREASAPTDPSIDRSQETLTSERSDRLTGRRADPSAEKTSETRKRRREKRRSENVRSKKNGSEKDRRESPTRSRSETSRRLRTDRDELVAKLSESLREARAELLASRFSQLPASSQIAPLQTRLEQLLRDAAQSLGCDAAAFYMIDPTESYLRLEVAWGLPEDRFASPSRPLRYARADLNALLGAPVALIESPQRPVRTPVESEPTFALSWNSPEPTYRSAMCAKVSTPTRTPGTLWAFSREARSFDEQQQYLWEQVASRVGMELEAQLLRTRISQESRATNLLRSLSCRRQLQFPLAGPFLDDWDFCGGLSRPEVHVSGCGGDWFCGERGLIVTVSETKDSDPCAAIQASELRMVLRSLGPISESMETLLERTHRTLWTASAGEMGFSVLVGVLYPEYGGFRYACAGTAGIYRVTPEEAQEVTRSSQWLATSPEFEEDHLEYEENPEQGSAMLLLSRVPELSVSQQRRFTRTLVSGLSEGAKGVMAAAREFLMSEEKAWSERPHTMIVMRRRVV